MNLVKQRKNLNQREREREEVGGIWERSERWERMKFVPKRRINSIPVNSKAERLEAEKNEKRSRREN